MTLAIRGSSSTTSTRMSQVSRASHEPAMNAFGAVTASSRGIRTVGLMNPRRRSKVKKLVALVGITGAIAGCGSSSSPKPATNTTAVQTGGHPAGVRFVSSVDNAWFPLKPGTTLVYRGVKDGKPSRDVVTVEHTTKTVDGVPCTVVKDLLYLS